MSYSITPELLMQLAVPGSGQQFETTVVNDNFTKIDTRAAANKTSLDTLVANFAITDTATTLAAILTAPSGSVRSVSANGSMWRWTGSVWRLLNVPVVADAAARDALYVAPVAVAQGDSVFRADLGRAEVYYALYNVTTNPGGMPSAGWALVDKPGLIKPSAASVTANGSAVINNDGSVTITMTGAGTCVLTNSNPTIAAYGTDVQEVSLSGTATATAVVGLQMASAGTAAAGATDYDWYGTSQTQANVAPAWAGQAGVNSWSLTNTGAVKNIEARIELRHANVATSTIGDARITNVITQWTSMLRKDLSLDHRPATAYDGLAFTFSAAGTYTVKVRPRP